MSEKLKVYLNEKGTEMTKKIPRLYSKNVHSVAFGGKIHPVFCHKFRSIIPSYVFYRFFFFYQSWQKMIGNLV